MTIFFVLEHARDLAENFEELLFFFFFFDGRLKFAIFLSEDLFFYFREHLSVVFLVLGTGLESCVLGFTSGKQYGTMHLIPYLKISTTESMENKLIGMDWV